MSWANKYIELLRNGETVQFRPRGNSMSPKIKNGQLVTVKPITDKFSIKKGDIVLCRVKGRQYLHYVESVQHKLSGSRFQICNAKKHTNGTIGLRHIYGKLEKIEW